MSLDSLLRVTIDFKTSHLLFPIIIGTLLAVLFLAILATQWRSIGATLATRPAWPAGIDQMRFFGTIALTIVYFLTMPPLGDLYPNTGFGFAVCSIPYLFALGALYLHHRGPRQLLAVGLNAVIAPLVVWYLFSELFNISLP